MRVKYRMPVWYYTETVGIRGIVRLSNDGLEDTKRPDKKIMREHVVHKTEQYYLMSCITWLLNYNMKKDELIYSMHKINSFSTVTEEEYQKYKEENGGILDSDGYYLDRQIAISTRDYSIDQITKLTPNCPQCRRGMIRREGKFGKFWGCSSYPYCRGRRRKDDSIAAVEAYWAEVIRLYLIERIIRKELGATDV